MSIIFNTPAIFLFVGRQKAGKGNLCASILHKMISTGSLGFGMAFLTTMDDNFQFLDPKYVYTELNEEMVYDFLKEALTRREKEHFWLLFDDGIGKMNFYSELFKHLGSSSRNYNISVFILNQQYNKVTPILRNNSSYIFCFRFDNKEHTLEIYNENGCFASKEEFLQEYVKCTSVKYQCLLIDKTKDDGLHLLKLKSTKFKCTNKIIYHS